MNLLREKLKASPLFARVAPFVVFLLIGFGQGKFGESSRYWFYLAKTLVGASLVWEMWPFVSEMRWALSWEAIVVGVGVCVIWVGLDGHYPTVNELLQKYLCPVLKRVGLESWCAEPSASTKLWNPYQQFGQGSTWASAMVLVRILGSSIVVPPLEEVFFRSFLYRYIAKPDFQSVPFHRFAWTPLLGTVAVFGFEHYQWLAGILCGFAYQWLVIRKDRLGDAVTAHAITNFLLGVWVVWKGAWQFW